MVFQSTDEEWILMSRVASGDEAAIAELYDRFGALVYKSCLTTLRVRAEAEDAAQDVFVQIWRTADKYDPQRAKLVTWVMLITRRCLIDRLRRKKVRPTMAGLTPEMANEVRDESTLEAAPSDLSPDMRRRLADLPEQQRVVIERVYMQGYSLREVSEQTGLPLGTVKSALSRGLQRLRDRYGIDRAIG